MTTASRSLIVIGFGNPGRLDDGLGPAFAERVEELGLPNVTIESNYQLTVEDAKLIADHDIALFADAALYCEEAFYVKPVEPEADTSFCTHSVSPGQVYHLAQSLFNSKAKAYVLGIRGYEFNEFGERLSEPALANLAEAVELFQSLADKNWDLDVICQDDSIPREDRPSQGEKENE